MPLDVAPWKLCECQEQCCSICYIQFVGPGPPALAAVLPLPCLQSQAIVFFLNRALARECSLMHRSCNCILCLQYAQDGLDIWDAFLNYFTSYLRLYYKSSEEVQQDPEIQAWWKEIKVGKRHIHLCCCGFAGQVVHWKQPTVQRKGLTA